MEPINILVIDDIIGNLKKPLAQKAFLRRTDNDNFNFSFFDAKFNATDRYSVIAVVEYFNSLHDDKLPDIILLDVVFGYQGRLGYEILQWLVASYSSIPVIMLTAEARSIYLDDALSSGAVDYLDKQNLSQHEFQNTILRYLATDPKLRLIGQSDQFLQFVDKLCNFSSVGQYLFLQAPKSTEHGIAATYLMNLFAMQGLETVIFMEPLAFLDKQLDNKKIPIIYGIESVSENEQKQIEDYLTRENYKKCVFISPNYLSLDVKRGDFNRSLYDLITENVVHLPTLVERRSDVPLILNSYMSASSQTIRANNMTSTEIEIILSHSFENDLDDLEAIIRTIQKSSTVENRLSELQRLSSLATNEQNTPEPNTSTRDQVSNVDSFLERVASHKAEYTIVHDGEPLIIFPGVFSPKYSHSSDFLISQLPNCKGMTTLDVGSGTGVLGLSTLKRGARHCTFVDINPKAVENTRSNLVLRGQERKGRVILSNLFERIEGRFDLIVTNPPFWNKPPKTMLERSCYDSNHLFIRNLLVDAPQYLKPDGQLAMVMSDQSDITLITNLFAEHGWVFNNIQMEVARSASGSAPHVRIVWLATIKS